MSASLRTFDEILKEEYKTLAADLKRDIHRDLFYDPNPVYGPPEPTWVLSGKMFNDAPYWDPPDYYWDESCEYCGRGDYE